MLLVIAVLVLAAVAMTGINVFGASTTDRTATFDGVTGITLDLDNASVDLVAGGNEVVVDQRVRTGRFGGEATAEVDDGRLEVVLDCSSLAWFSFGRGCRGEYVITVPAGIPVDGESSNGAIRIDGLDGLVNVGTSNGEVMVTNTAGPLRLDSSNGRIVGTDLASPDVTATTSNGQISLSFAAPPHDVVADTSNGEIVVEVPDDGQPWTVDATTSNGQVSTDIATDPSAGRTLQLHTSNGSIDVRYTN